jgi:hypothetical protein
VGDILAVNGAIQGEKWAMFFDVEKEIDDKRYILMMLSLQSSEDEEPMPVAQLLSFAAEILGADIERDDLLSIYYLRLIHLTPQGEGYANGADDELVNISHVGLAALINGAPLFLDRITTNYDVPEGTLASLVPLLDVSRVPAADRYVSTADNQELFAELVEQLENVKSKLVRDQNKNDLPILVQEKRAIAAELDGLVGQIKAGYIRLSDLTQRAGPLVKNIADTCKDVGIIAGFAYAAYEVIGKILAGLFLNFAAYNFTLLFCTIFPVALAPESLVN